MFGSGIKAELRHCQQLAASQSRILDAIRQNLAWIEFTRDGEILDANQAFLNVVGYSLDEVRGQHHSLFCTPEMTAGADYRRFW